MKMKDTVKSTSNSTLYNKIVKRYKENKGMINCAYCPYHRGENRSYHSDVKSWKNYRKTQYKVKEI